jgi:DNA-binding MarR family transcriptional regulator
MGTTASAEHSDLLDETALGGRVRSAVGRIYRRFRTERPEGTLGDTALDVLTWLDKVGPQTLTQLSDRGNVAPASMSQSVNRLTSSGYAIRTPDPSDRRKVLFSTTPEGASLARDTRTRRNSWLDVRLQALSPDDQKAIARACELLGEIADS